MLMLNFQDLLIVSWNPIKAVAAALKMVEDKLDSQFLR